MKPDLYSAVCGEEEELIFKLRSLYAQYGYRRFRMSRFEPYELYARNKDFLLSDRMITFTDTDGTLMALKPDVTMSIIKSSDVNAAGFTNGELTRRLYYNESVFRAEREDEAFREITQTGLELLGEKGIDEIAEVLELAVLSLVQISPEYVLDISHLDLLKALFEEIDIDSERRADILRCVQDKNVSKLEEAVAEGLLTDDAAALISRLIALSGRASEVLPQLSDLVRSRDGFAALAELKAVCAVLDGKGLLGNVRIDFSLVNNMNYYNGIIFQGFIPTMAQQVLSGGEYDRLLQKMGKPICGIGFAINLDRLQRVETGAQSVEAGDQDWLNIALPKGRLGEQVYRLFEAAGFPCYAVLDNSRKLIFENTELKIRYFLVKATDVAIYVERGAADIGVCGFDILLEYAPDVYELLDLRCGCCRFAVAALRDFVDNRDKTLRVATKYPRVAGRFFSGKSRDIDIIRLNGSIEIAPILKLADVIVDIVETGRTLKDNDLCVVEEMMPISARLIANKAQSKFKAKRLEELLADMRTMLAER
jgi:ATP phosphoribosyltransferase